MRVVLRLGVAALVTAALTSLHAGCQSHPPERPDGGSPAAAPAPVVASVGHYSIDADDFRDAVHSLLGEARAVSDLSAEERREILGILCDARLVALDAEHRGLDRLPSVRTALEGTERTAINAVTYRRQVETQVEITPEDVREQYALWGSGEVMEPAHILVPTREEADSILAAVQAGADFGELARQRSRHGGSSMRRGSMGYLRKFLVPDAIRERIWDLPDGAVYPEPIHTIMGYHVVKVLRRGQQTLEEQEKAIRGFLGRKRRAILERDLHSRLRDKYGYEWRGETVARLVREGVEGAADTALARWRGGELTLTEYRDRAAPPDVSTRDTSRVHKVVDDLAAEELIGLEGRAQGLHQVPEVRRAVEAARLRALGEALFRDLAEAADTSAAAREAFYRDHRDSYRGPERLTVQEILVAERSTADSLHALISAGADMADLARRHSLREETREGGGIWENVPKYGQGSATVYRLAMKSEGLLEPVQLSPDRFSVIRKVSARPGPILPLEEVEESIRRDLQTVAMDTHIAGLRRRYRDRVRVHDEILDGLD